MLLMIFCMTAFSQEQEAHNHYTNSAEKLLETEGNLSIGGYGEVHYNQPLDQGTLNNGKLDVHRLVMLFGYRFNERIQFISEIEFEHVSEVYIEQAFLQYKLNDFISFRGGLLLIPMGIINEYHEPTTFNGVERPLVDSKISPTTWREIGLGVTGTLLPASVRYQIYLVNGFNGYDGSARFSGSGGLRGGRQKGAESYISSPNLTARVEFFGLRGLNVGVSAYAGDSQSTLYNGIDKNDEIAKAQADSSVVGIRMFGADARYSLSGLYLRGQFYYTSLSNTTPYNHFTGDGVTPNDLGSAMTGYYAEIAYDIFSLLTDTKMQLIPFVRYEAYNTHQSVESDFTVNDSYQVGAVTTGITLKLAPGAVVKADMQFLKPKSADSYSKVFNAGLGVMF